jgi:hypothetical protein
VVGVPGKHLVQVSLAEDQHLVGTSVRSVRINRSAKQFRPRTPRQDLHHLDTCGRQDRVECRLLNSRSGPSG